MLPSIVKLKSCDVYRDGGSLSTSFESKDGIEHTLFFGIKHRISPEKEIIPIGYNSPILQKFIKSEYVSKITGISSPKWEQEEIEVSWEVAASILAECSKFISGLETEYSWVFPRMVDIAGSKGAYHAHS